ncbi:MAG: extracellular solute-binding protein [Rhodospirillaceae bacterium]|nr:extracellular solute-binding protein [Rhodospirillaceae bacterium]
MNAPNIPERSGRRGFQTWTLALVLSAALIAGWAVFLALAPSPQVLAPPAAVAADPPVESTPVNQVRLLVGRDAMAVDVLANFTADTGLKVVLDTYDTTEQSEALAASATNAPDVIMVSGVGLKALADINLLQTIARTDLVNARNIDPALAARTVIYDPDNTHSVPLLWGTIGLGFNAAKLAERLGPGVVPDSWAALFDPTSAAKLADCGIQVIDSPTGVFPIALAYLGLPAESVKIEDTDAATRLWESIRPSIAKFSSQDIIDNLAAGTVCLAAATSGDAYQARDRARIAGLANDIRYILPKEGAVVVYELLAIPKASVNSANALRLIDYLLRPEVAARMTNAKGFANAVLGSTLYVKPEIKSDPQLAPDLANLRAMAEMSPAPAIAALRNRFWQLINAPVAPPLPAPASAPAAVPAPEAPPNPPLPQRDR